MWRDGEIGGEPDLVEMQLERMCHERHLIPERSAGVLRELRCDRRHSQPGGWWQALRTPST